MIMNFIKRHYRKIIALFLIWIGVTFFNVTKAIHIDDTAYLEIARHIKSDPLHPMSGEISWRDFSQPIYVEDQPPLILYFYALTMYIFGESEIALHLLISFFSLAAIFFFFLLMQKFAPQIALFITATFSLGPVFIPGQNLMMDIPALAFWLAFFWFLFALKITPKRRYIIAAFVSSAACLIKYHSLVLIPILMLDIVIRKNWRLLWIASIPLLVLSGWSFSNYLEYGSIHILDREVIRIFPFYRIRGMVICLGAISPFSIILFARRDKHYVWACGLLLAITAFFFDLFFGNFINTSDSNVNSILRAGFFSSGMLLIYYTFYYCIKNFRWQRIFKNSDESVCFLILMLWFLGSTGFIFLFAHFMAVRHFLIIIPAMLLILSFNKAHKIQKGWLYAGMFVTIFLGVILGISDWAYADLYRVQAKKIKEHFNDKSENAIWHVGHWGWQWYASKSGMKLYDFKLSAPKSGDLLVAPLLVDKQDIIDEHWRRLKLVHKITVDASPATYFRTMSLRQWGGYYYLPDNRMAWRIERRAPLEEFLIYQFESIGE